ncbi:hypothetical protein [uncultured Winogradskyella sp.]|uniref:GldL-related protein n=1 Tax=uncultured Winogradskyella sp. TaxID=395353 RepID=UPI0026223576|nr:hypothetical protein [uncultured Winogradskyella sp.]
MNKKILTLPLRLALVILIIGALFKVMHWPYSKELMFFSGISIGLMYIIRFLNKKSKITLDYVKLGLVTLWVISYLINVFHLYSIPYVIEICLIVLFIWWFAEEGIFYFKNRKFKKKGLVKVIYYTLLLIGLTAFLFGLLFKIQHWPYGSLLFVLGTLMLCIILILDYLVIKKSP